MTIAELESQKATLLTNRFQEQQSLEVVQAQLAKCKANIDAMSGAIQMLDILLQKEQQAAKEADKKAELAEEEMPDLRQEE